jgi:type VI protein secretion system component Hcp
MSESNKPTEKQPKTPQTDQPLPEAALEKVSGGKTSLGPIIFTKHYDKSSPYIG